MTTGIEIDARRFRRLMAELARRGQGSRESGAFLLSTNRTQTHGPHRDSRPIVTRVAYYDDLDPGSLTGGITFGADGYSALNAVCRRGQLHVVADVHTHPRTWVGQSETDAGHPMSALVGHVALIAPNFARGRVRPEDLGVHVLDGFGRWASYFGQDAAHLVHLLTRRAVMVHRLRSLPRSLWSRLTRVGRG
jgi:hypothetical protein